MDNKTAQARAKDFPEPRPPVTMVYRVSALNSGRYASLMSMSFVTLSRYDVYHWLLSHVVIEVDVLYYGL